MSHFFYAQEPEHPDYEQLNRIVKDLDKALEQEGRSATELVVPYADVYSAQYLAEQRAALVCAQLGINPRMRPYLAATFLNAFTIGVIWEREKCREERDRDRHR